MPLLGMYDGEGTALILFPERAERAQRDGSLVIHTIYCRTIRTI